MGINSKNVVGRGYSYYRGTSLDLEILLTKKISNREYSLSVGVGVAGEKPFENAMFKEFKGSNGLIILEVKEWIEEVKKDLRAKHGRLTKLEYYIDITDGYKIDYL